MSTPTMFHCHRLSLLSMMSRRKRPLQMYRSLSTSAGAASTATASVPSLYVAATRQHAGKTTVSLALMSGLQKRFDNRVGFIKPIGEFSALRYDNPAEEPVQVDKDALLFKEHFQLDHVPWEHASPVIIPPGYTRSYLDGTITLDGQRERLQQAFDTIAENSHLVLCEGTGHCAVGSIVDASNADIAEWLKSPMVLVVNGGLGRSVDELTLNLTLCEQHGVPVAGVIMNQVQPEKYKQTVHYVTKAMQRKWPDIPVVGCIPDLPFLGSPALSDLEDLLDGTLLSGGEHLLRHYRVRRDLHLVACSLESFLQQLQQRRASSSLDDEHQRRTLFVCHASRIDILVGFLMEAMEHRYSLQQQQEGDSRGPEDESLRWQASILVTGCGDFPLSQQVVDMVKAMPDAPPVLTTPHPTDTALDLIYGFTAKLNVQDSHRVNAAIEHYEGHIDFDALLERVLALQQSSSTTATANGQLQ